MSGDTVSATKTRQSALHPSAIMSGADAESYMRHVGFWRNQTFSRATVNDRLWSRAAVAEWRTGRQLSASRRPEPASRQSAQKLPLGLSIFELQFPTRTEHLRNWARGPGPQLPEAAVLSLIGWRCLGPGASPGGRGERAWLVGDGWGAGVGSGGFGGDFSDYGFEGFWGLAAED